jgi:anti-sigma regulatory factor (Ser/Thr protein kinase)
MEQNFKREMGSLDDVFDFTDTFIKRFDLGADAAYLTRLVVEELFTNQVKYNRAAREDIAIHLEKQGGRLTISIMDFNAEPFDASQVEPVDVHAPLDRRMIGRLGIHIVKGLVDTLTFDYTEGKRMLCITAVKNLEAKDA